MLARFIPRVARWAEVALTVEQQAYLDAVGKVVPNV